MWAVYDTGTSTHSPSQQQWIPAASLITKNKVGHPVQLEFNYPETLFISTGKAPSRLEFQYGHSSKSVNYKCNRIIENLSKSKTIPSDITQSKDTL